MPKPFTKKRSQGALSATNVNNKKCEPMQNCFNLDDMMQFEAARQRALAHFVPENDSKLFNEFVANRIFINNVDLFNGSYYVKVSSTGSVSNPPGVVAGPFFHDRTPSISSICPKSKNPKSRVRVQVTVKNWEQNFQAQRRIMKNLMKRPLRKTTIRPRTVRP